MKSLYLGIDTSNYKTSAAVTDDEGTVIAERSVLLDVPEGKRGLRQSEAFFMHSNRLPAYLSALFKEADPSLIAAIGVSERPRRVEGSYMPCFLAGLNAAEITGSALSVPVYRFSHQEGHAAAVMEDGGPGGDEETIFFHLSGGTTEALRCRRDDRGYDMEIIGGTLDISVGQLLDRFGVACDLPFPAGRFLDDAAYDALEASDFDTRGISLPGIMPKIKINDGYFNLSGAETRLMNAAPGISTKEELSSYCAELFIKISDLLYREADHLSKRYGINRIVMAGGAASSRTVRRLLKDRKGLEITFGKPELSGDNAVGIARLASRINETGKCIPGK